jgi:hypothetical protein
MKTEFLPEADEEFREAARYYESEAPGIGLAFIAEVHRAISVITSHPNSAKILRGNIRKKSYLISPTVYFIASNQIS